MSDDEKVLAELGRMGRLIALATIRGLEKREAALILAQAGYNFVETGELLGISRNAAQLLVQRNKKGRARARAKT